MFTWFIKSCPDRQVKVCKFGRVKTELNVVVYHFLLARKTSYAAPLSRKPCVTENSFDVFQEHLVASYRLQVMISYILTCSSCTALKILLCPIMRLCPVPHGQRTKKQPFYWGINLGHPFVRLHLGWM